MKFVAVCLFLLCFSTTTFAWGERGHDLVTRVAARLIIERNTPDFSTPFVAKEHMLGHLSNIPDVYWRSNNVSKEDQKANDPTHFIDLEYLSVNPSFNNLPRSIAKVTARILELCEKMPKGYICPNGEDIEAKAALVGSAPFRIKQLYSAMVEHLKTIDATDKTSLINGVNNALLVGGLLSHFVADLAMPLHNSRDYDGWEEKLGGIHRYFEQDLVNSLPLSFDAEVFESANLNPSYKIFSSFSKTPLTEPLDIAYALSLESFGNKKALYDLDRKYSLEKASSNSGTKIYAIRKDPKMMAQYFHQLLVTRLAIGADVLATLWKNAWVEAGKPNLSGYQSYEYPTSPAFIPVNY